VKQVTSNGFSPAHGGREQAGHFQVGIGSGFQGRTMGQQLQPRRSGEGERLWLSMLIEAMEKFSRPEFPSLPCDRTVLATVKAQLARPSAPYCYRASPFSLRN
jgi:hypothetical protein